jgi:DNA-binding FadR family transcriptional regulator
MGLDKSVGTSRTEIRESLKAMESLGTIKAQPGIGRFIRDLNLEAILNKLPYSRETDSRTFKDILKIGSSLKSFIDRHHSIMEAIKSQDPARAHKSMIEHFEESMAWVEQHKRFIGNSE